MQVSNSFDTKNCGGFLCSCSLLDLEFLLYKDLLWKVEFETFREHAQVAADVPKLPFIRHICIEGGGGGAQRKE